MKLRQSILIGGSVVLTIAGLLLVPYKGLGRLQAMLFGCGAISGFVGGVKGRTLEEEQENWESQILEAKEHQKMIQQTTLPILQQEEMAIAQSRAQANVQLQSLEHQQHLQTVKQLKYPGLLEAQMEEARRRSEIENASRGDRQLQSSESVNSVSTNSELNAIQSANPHLEFYDFDDLVDDAAGIIIAGNTGAGKTSVACYVAGKLTEHNPAQVFALDPHYNDIWEEVGIHAIGEFSEIEEIIGLLVKELDDRRTRKKNKEPIGETIICFTDELNACLLNCTNQESLETALKRLGSEGRKFGIILIAINQSSNVDDLGISGPYRANFLLILLGASARTISEKWKNTDDRVKWVNDQVYPCCVAGCVGAKLAIHPTHNSYTKFKKKGNPPLNLLPINQSAHTFLPEKYRPSTDKSIHSLDSNLSTTDSDVNPKPPIKLDIEAQRDALTRIYELPEKEVTPWDEWLSESSSEEIDRLIDERRSRQDTPPGVAPETVDTSPDTSGYPLEVSESSVESGKDSKPLQGKEYPRKWDVDTFRRILPKEDENALFEKILEYLDTSVDTSGDRTKSYSKVIKFGLGFNKPRDHETRSYWNVGLPCFKYLLDQPGREALKLHFSKAWDSDSPDSETEVIE